ncbi:hypothetical protein PLICRDRAFT_275149 [Plicaturopsis crispa FD-325 SS-3]|nr:hypothetical protein PLICRDRAFT_275149 [Plicaturopsis crispa FD-325 SS-3]
MRAAFEANARRSLIHRGRKCSQSHLYQRYKASAEEVRRQKGLSARSDTNLPSAVGLSCLLAMFEESYTVQSGASLRVPQPVMDHFRTHHPPTWPIVFRSTTTILSALAS